MSILSQSLNILLWRQWSPPYQFPATFSVLSTHSIGGTDSQLLWHARNLVDMGHRVQVLGSTRHDIIDEEVEFIGSSDRSEQVHLIQNNRIRPPDVVFLEGAFDAAEFFRRSYPSAKIVHVGQNIDRIGHQAAFEMEAFIDIYCFVSTGHLAKYSVRHPHLRQKFLLLRNAVPWKRIYETMDKAVPSNRVVWIGSWGKKGLRQWAEVMEQILKEEPNCDWTLLGPSYGSQATEFPSYLFAGLHLPKERVAIKDLPMTHMAAEISSARVVLVSLGNETCGISALDAHAVGRPVLSGNDIVYKYTNPEGCGIRVTTFTEAYDALSFLMNNPELCNQLGSLGQRYIRANLTEQHQSDDLCNILSYLSVQSLLKPHIYPAPSDLRDSWSEHTDRLKRKVLQVSARIGSNMRLA